MSHNNADAAPPASGSEPLDPKNDPKRKAKSKDPGWKYSFWPEVGNRDLLQCSLCDRKLSGGIKRLKQHLVGGYGDVVKCGKTTESIRKEIHDYLNANKRYQPLVLDDVGEDDVAEVARVIASSATGSSAASTAASNAAQSSGTASKRKQSLLNFMVTQPKVKLNKSVVHMLRKTPEVIVEERHTKGTAAQASIESKMRTKEERHVVNMHVAKFFYECGIPFNAAHSRSFEVMCESIAQYGSRYKPPSYHELRVPLLEESVKEIDKIKEKHMEAWKQYGCTLMSDGWTDKRGRHLINFLVNSPEGTFFLESVDASSEVHDARMLADLLHKRIDDIGKDHVVQVITDNGANYKAAGKILMERMPTLFWTPCAAHCLDLMLEDIGKLKEFKKPISRAKHITTFIYRHGKLLSAMREKTGGRDLVRAGATRFATSFLTLRSLHKHKDALRYLFVSEDWTRSKLAATEAGKSVYDTVLSKEFWNSVEDCLRASQPLLVVLRVVDGDEKPAMPEVMALMTEAKEKIKIAFPSQNKSRLLKKIMAIVDTRWVKQMEQKLHGAALFLNPGKFFAIQKGGDDTLVGLLRGCFTQVIRKMVPDVSLRSKIERQSIDYEAQRGDQFSSESTIHNQTILSPGMF